jgi:hypothetical protein
VLTNQHAASTEGAGGLREVSLYRESGKGRASPYGSEEVRFERVLTNGVAAFSEHQMAAGDSNHREDAISFETSEKGHQIYHPE